MDRIWKSYTDTGQHQRFAFWLEDVTRADFFAITAPAQANFSLNNVHDFRLAWSRAAKDATIAEAEKQLV